MTTKIIATSRYKKIFEKFSFVLLALVLTLTFIIRDPNAISYCKKWYSDTVGYIVLIIYLTLIVAFFVLYYLSRKRKILGKITMTSELIAIEAINQIVKFNISELDNFKVDSKFLRTKTELASLMSSIDNWIIFDFDKNTYKYQFQITSGYDGNRFRELMVEWSKNGNFTLINENKNTA